MIKLTRPDKPIELTEEVEKELIKEFKATGKSVWRKPYIVDALAEMSHKKCCYCETELGTQGRALQVEHYHYKDAYPDEVVSWENLLPSCSQCNSNKGTHDTIKDGAILDPTKDDPKEFLYLKHYMIKSKDNTINSKGRLTIELLDLNNRERLIVPRIEIADAMQKQLEAVHEKAIKFAERVDGKQYNKTRIVTEIKNILKMAQADASYSAFMSTMILTDEDYIETVKIMKNRGLWNKELEDLHNDASNLKLDTQNRQTLDH